MELKWLEDLLVLLDEGSFTKAAKRRNVTQPAFSRRIKALEDWLGQSLVDRSVFPIRISDATWKAESEVRALANRIHELKSRFRSEDGDLTRLTFGCQHTLAVSCFPDLIRTINASRERFSYRIRSANKDLCVVMCLRGEVDFLLCYESDNEVTEPDLTTLAFRRLVWGRDRLVPVVGSTLRHHFDLENQTPEPIPFISYPDSSFLGRVVASSCVSNLVREFKVDWVCESAFSVSLKEMVIKGLGLAWVPLSLIKADIEAGRLHNLADRLGGCQLNIVVYAAQSSPSAEKVFEILESAREPDLNIAF